MREVQALDAPVEAQKVWAKYDVGTEGGFLWPTAPEELRMVIQALRLCGCGVCAKELMQAPTINSGWRQG